MVNVSVRLDKLLSSPRIQPWTRLALRLSLAAAFFSAVADRFGIWGEAGQPGVVWGNYAAFLDYTHLLLAPLPRWVSDWFGTIATGLEVLLGTWLVAGWRTRWAGLCSALLLLIFATSMLLAVGPKPMLDYSVLTAAAAALALATAHDRS